MKRPLVIVAVLAILVAATVGIVFAFSDSQVASGGVTATSASVDLYICEASPDVPGAECANDDSGEDEMIFEGLEDLIPGSVAEWDIRLVNEGMNPWDVLAVDTQVSVASDPGSDCQTLLLGGTSVGMLAIIPKPIGLGPDSESLDFDPAMDGANICGQPERRDCDRSINELRGHEYSCRLDERCRCEFRY